MPGAIKVDLGRVEVVSMRELTLHTAAVIQRLRAEGVPRVVVKHGRFQAALWPLPPGVEADLLADAVQRGDLSVEGPMQGVSVEDLLQDSGAARPTSKSVGGSGSGDSCQRSDQSFVTATMSELNQNPSAVVDRVRQGERLIITRHGRFVALLVPLPSNIESRLLAAASDFLQTLDDGRGEFSSGMEVDLAEAWTTS